MANEVVSPTENSGAGGIIVGVSSVDEVSQIKVRIDPTTKRVLTSATVASSALPTGAATEAKQDNQIVLETSIEAELGSQTTQLSAIAESTGNMDADLDTVVLQQVTQTTLLQGIAGFTVTGYDYIVLTYVAAGNGAGEIETVVFKTGGSGGTTIATLTLAYDANNNLTSVTKT